MDRPNSIYDAKNIWMYRDFPCVKEKCLKYPMCTGKEVICCTELHDYLRNLDLDFDDTWALINRFLPEAKRLTLDSGKLKSLINQ